MNWPFENNTVTIVKHLTKRSLQSEKRRNIMVVISVILAAFLISFGGGLAVSLVQMQNNQIDDTYEAVYRNLTLQDMENIKAQPEIARVGEYYLIGEEVSKQGFIGSFIYANADMLYIGRKQIELLEGKLPEQLNEIIVNKSWLTKYAPSLTIGDMVSLDTENFQDKYIISGITNNLTVEGSETYPFIISKELLIQYKDYQASGYRAYIHLLHDTEMSEEEITAYCDNLAENYDFSSPAYNSLYFTRLSNNTSMGTAAIIGLLGGIVLIGGGVVIQSIFRISIIDKIQSFGQLRTLGATKKQITQMVRKEGRQLGGIGVILGTLFGIIIPIFLVPDGINIGGYVAVAIATALICRVMIVISIRKPVQIAANVSPIEAVRFVSEQRNLAHSKKIHRRLNPLVLGKMNFTRDKKKMVSIIVSLSIGGLLLLCASTLVLTYSPEILARKYFPNGDYKIYIDSERKMSDVLSSGSPLTDELHQEILSIDGVEGIITTRQSVGSSFNTPLYSGGGMVDMITQDNDSLIEEALLVGYMPADAYSILAGSLYEEELEVGSTIELTLGGNTATVTVCGMFDSTAISVGHGHKNLMLDTAMFFLPEELFHEMLPNVERFDYTWDIISDPDKEIIVKSSLEKLVNSHTEIAMDLFTELIAYNKSVYTVPFRVLQGVALFISLFGVINLINTTLSNQISRKKEVSVLRSVGLTQKQLYQMITLEGVSYALLSIFLTILLGTPLAYILHREVSRMAYGAPTAFQFPFLYVMLYFLLLIVIEFILSTWAIRKQGKQSLIEQLREI